MVSVSEHLDTVGPMARSVRDAAHILQVIAGADLFDDYTSRIPGSILDYAAACKKDALRGARLGVPWNILEMMAPDQTPEVSMFKKMVEVMRGEGADIVDANFTLPNAWNDVTDMLTIDFRSAQPKHSGSLSQPKQYHQP